MKDIEAPITVEKLLTVLNFFPHFIFITYWAIVKFSLKSLCFFEPH